MGKRASGLDKGQEVWGRAKLGPQGTKKGCTSRKEPFFPKNMTFDPKISPWPKLFY